MKFFNRTYNPQMRQSQIVAQSQAIDHLLVLMVGLGFLCSGLSFFVSSVTNHLHQVGPSFWVGTLFLFIVLGLFYRLACFLFYQNTLGQYLVGLRFPQRSHLKEVMPAIVVESFHLVFPLLWAYDFICRAYFQPLKPDYVFHYRS